MKVILAIDEFSNPQTFRYWTVEGSTVVMQGNASDMPARRTDGVLIVGEFDACLSIVDEKPGMVLYRLAEECHDPMPWVLKEQSIADGMGSHAVHLAAMRVLERGHTDK